MGMGYGQNAYGKMGGNYAAGGLVEHDRDPNARVNREYMQAPQVMQQDPLAAARFGQVAPGFVGMTQTPQGWDFTGQGVGEQFFQGNQGQFVAPGRGASWWAGNENQFAAPGAAERFGEQQLKGAGQATRSEQLYDRDPGLGAYYDRAKARTAGDLNAQLASRGAFGSSAGVSQISDAFQGLEAQRANREADYMANLAGQADQMQMAQRGQMGQLANQAQAARMGRLGQAASTAMGVDASELARLTGGMNAASQAQEMRRQRGRDYMEDLFRPTMALNQTVGQGLQGMIGADQALMDSVIATQLGLGREAVNQEYRNQEQHRADIGMVMDIIGSFMGGGGGGMGGM